MQYYQIYITPELVKKALKKGCPLTKVVQQYTSQHPIYYTLPYDDPNWFQCDAYYFPTAEEMMGYLREKHNIDISITINDHDESRKYGFTIYKDNQIVDSVAYPWMKYRPTILEAIDMALDLI